MLQYSASAIITSAQIEAALQHSAHLHHQKTGCNPATTRYSDVKREFEASLNFNLYLTFGSFVSIITLPDGTKEPIVCNATQFEDYFADMCYYDPSRRGPFADWEWTRKPFIDKWLYDMTAATLHKVISDPTKPHGLLLHADQRQTTKEGYLLPPYYNLHCNVLNQQQSFDELRRLQCAEAARLRAETATAC